VFKFKYPCLNRHMLPVDELRYKLIEECGKSVACIRAVEYYMQRLQNPCYPPDIRLTTKTRKYLIKLLEQYPPPQCDVAKLVRERLRGTRIENLADDAAELASKIKKQLFISSRAAAALAVYLVARKKNIQLSFTYLSKLFNISTATITTNLEKFRTIRIFQN